MALEAAKEQVLAASSAQDAAAALEVLAAASADVSKRGALKDGVLFEKLLEFCGVKFAEIPSAPKRSLFRCLGNLVADNEEHRKLMVTCSGCMRGLEGLLADYQPDQQDTEFEDFAIKMLYNLCNNSPQTQQQAVKDEVDWFVIMYIRKRTWSQDDEPLLSIATDLAARLTDLKSEHRPSEDYTKLDKVGHITGLADKTQFIEDSEALFDILTVLSAYLQDETFVQQAVQSKMLEAVYRDLKATEKVANRINADEDSDPNDKKLVHSYVAILSQGLIDMSSLPTFNELYSPSDPFIVQLATECQNLDASAVQMHHAVGGLILGNLAISDESSTALLAPPTSLNVPALFSLLATANNTPFLNAAAGLLRHLCIPMTSRVEAFDNPLYLAQTAHLYTSITVDGVKIAGLQLTKQILSNMPARTAEFILHSSTAPESQSGPNQQTAPTLQTFLDVFHASASTAVKIEIARLITSFLRTLQLPAPQSNHPDNTAATAASPPSPASSPTQKALTLLTQTPSITAPLLYTIKQPPSPQTTKAHAEAWLALNLLARVTPGGAGAVGALFEEDEEMLVALGRKLGGGQQAGKVGETARVQELEDDAGDGEGEESALVEQDGDVAAEAQGDQAPDARPQWVKDKERDNAVVLASDVLRSGEVDVRVKRKLRAVLARAGIKIDGDGDEEGDGEA